MSNVRSALGFDKPYWTINREERNYAALLYHCLLSGDNLGSFLDHIGCDFPIREEELSTYVEYAFLRDVWEHRKPTNETKRALIADLLDTDDVRSLDGATTLDWNQHFGVGTPVASGTFIQSPSRWSIQKFSPNITSHSDFLATCRFKWSFNIKPDLVIHTSNDQAIVIEAKYHSGEGTYPASSPEKVIFAQRGIPPVGQTELQQYMFESLLGVEALYLYVVQDPKAKSVTHRTLVWSEIFAALDLTGVPRFVEQWLAALAE